MGYMDGRLGNATPTTYWHQLHWWKSPRWIVIRIEALAVLAIVISFLLAIFGSCRRWSNRWIVQKGFFAAQVLSLSLGTYSIGLMQSSSVKSEMYPIWTVSLFVLFGCIDPVTTYNGLDYKGPLSKVVYGICLNCGYVLLMSISSISNVVGNTAIITLSAISFIKGFHRSFALVQQNRMRDMVYALDNSQREARLIRKDKPRSLRDMRCMITVDVDTCISLFDLQVSIMKNKDKRIRSCYDVCVALCLSHRLQQHILGLDYRVPRPETLKDIDYKWALKVIEIELAFVYDAFFTGNPFLHYYQAKTANLWALASLSGICFVLAATVIPGGVTRRFGASGCTRVVDTTATDLAITFGILVSLALLHLTQLVRSWTSNWAKAAVACACARKKVEENRRVLFRHSREKRPRKNAEENRYRWELPERHLRRTCRLSGWMRLKVLVATSTNMFDKYLWQDNISQYSMLPEPRLLTSGDRKCEGISSSETKGEPKWGRLLTGGERKGDGIYSSTAKARLNWSRLFASLEGKGASKTKGERICTFERKGELKRWRCVDIVQVLGLHYIWQVIWELLSSDTNKRGGVKLDEDVKGSVIDFLGHIQSDTLDRNWLSSLPEEPQIRYFLPHFDDPRLHNKPGVHCYRYTSCVLTWHIATWYCELAEHKRQEDALMSKQAEVSIGCGRETTATASYYLRKAAVAIARLSNFFQRRRRGGEGRMKTRDHRRVANALSQYCVYLLKSAPELLPGSVARTKRVYDRFVTRTKIEARDKDTILENMSDDIFFTYWYRDDDIFVNGGALAKLLMRRTDTWETLALVWVQLLVYAAPYGNVEAHMKRLSQGGEFITHLWALLYHLDIREWKLHGNLDEITSINDAERVLTQDGQAVVAFLYKHDDSNHGAVATASLLEDGVRYYYTDENSFLAARFGIQRDKLPGLVFLKKEDSNHKFILYDGEFRAYDIARFVTENKIAFDHNQAQALSLEDFGGQSEDEIEENSAYQSTEDDGGQSEDKTEENSAYQSSEHDGGQSKTEIEDEIPLSLQLYLWNLQTEDSKDSPFSGEIESPTILPEPTDSDRDRDKLKDHDVSSIGSGMDFDEREGSIV